MGCRIMEDRESGNAVFYCSTSMWAFGPVMESPEEAERFLKWLVVDPRRLTDKDLEQKYCDFRKYAEEHCPECEEPLTYRCPHGNCKGCGCAECEEWDLASERMLDRETP